MKDSLLAKSDRQDLQQRALSFGGTFGLVFLVLSLYGDFGSFYSMSGVSFFAFAKSLACGMSIAGLLFVFGKGSVKVVLGLSVILFIGINLLVILHLVVGYFATTFRGCFVAEGFFIGVSIPIVIFLWLEHKRPVDDIDRDGDVVEPS